MFTTDNQRMPPPPTGAQQNGLLRLDPARLAGTNINPTTGLATDFLNHFNEAVMLLELLPSCPDCLDDLLAWRPMSYHDHFEASKFRDRELAIAAYDAADPVARRALDDIADSMNTILTATREGLERLSPGAAARLAEQAAGWLKPLVARAGGVINGVFTTKADAPQDAIDALFAR